MLILLKVCVILLAIGWKYCLGLVLCAFYLCFLFFSEWGIWHSKWDWLKSVWVTHLLLIAQAPDKRGSDSVLRALNPVGPHFFPSKPSIFFFVIECIERLSIREVKKALGLRILIRQDSNNSKNSKKNTQVLLLAHWPALSTNLLWL